MSMRPSDRRRRTRSTDHFRVALVVLLLLFADAYLLPSVITGPWVPDLLLLALLLLAIRQPPGTAAVIGFAVGLVADVLTPAHFGAGILAHVLVGWGASWGRSVFFADNLFVNAALFAIGTWVRNLIVLLLSGTGASALLVQLTVWSPLQGLSTAAVGVLVVVLFRDWLAIRIDP
jgi:rod shape-determining protein MreD